MFKSAITRAFYLGTMFLANLLLANLLLPFHFGTLTLMILNASVLSILTGLGTDSIILHSLVNKKWSIGQAQLFTGRVLLFQTFLFVLLEVLCIILFNKTLLTQSEISYFVPEITFFLGLILTDKLVILFYSNQRATTANLILFFSAAFYISILVFVKYNYSIESTNLILLFSLQSLFQGILLLIVYYLITKVCFENFTSASVVEAFKLSLIILITNIIQFFAYRIDYYFLERFYSDYEVGVFAQSNKIANLMWIVPNIFALLLIPKFGQLNSNLYQHVFKLAFIKNILLAVITLISGYIAFVYILKPEYKEGLNAFYIMVPGYFCWATVIYFGAFFSYLGKFHFNLIASSFCFVMILVTDLLFIPSFGINGAAISNTISYSATLILYIILYYKSQKDLPLGFFNFNKSDFRLIVNALK